MIDAFVGHLTGDYILQNDYLAIGKKKSSLICAAHCAIWTACVCLLAGWPSPLAIAILFITHFAQDRGSVVSMWMDAIGQKSFRQNLAPWSSIVVDNVLHIITIWAVWRFVI